MNQNINQNQKTILVLEDEDSLIKAIKIKLELENFRVEVAKSVKDALFLLEKNSKIDAIWLDHYLIGKETGLDFITKIKLESSPWKNIPIFVISNSISADKVQTYLKAGVNRYFTKADYRLDQIIEEILTSLSKKG